MLGEFGDVSLFVRITRERLCYAKASGSSSSESGEDGDFDIAVLVLCDDGLHS